MSVFIYQDGQLASSWGSTAPETPSCWKHLGHDSPYLQQTSPWVTNLNFDTSVEVVEVVSELACEGGVALPCSVSWTFLKAPFARRPQRSPWPPCKAHGYGRGGPSHPKNWVYARKRCHNTSPLHNLFFFSLCQAFCTYPFAPPVGSPQNLHRLCLFIHFALPSVCCWLLLGKLSFTRGDDLGADSTLLWPGPETTSCTQLPIGSCTQLPMMLLLRHLLSASRDAGRCERPLSASAAVLSRATYCFGERKVPN